ncbi:carboxypeptidase regulatory-like domain-containing protein [Tunturiibacter lichenicola]|uniref:carboxypeptidase-like regulatory domain-containing protein n=1 Tax=Tunturiibacter lichenicola TaxID=2051959 RepID=UPI003D9BF9CF
MNETHPKHIFHVSFLQAVVLIVCLLFSAGADVVTVAAYGQVITASLSGTVTDSSGAVVPKASIALKNQATGDTRTINSNSGGFFTFAGVSSGDYALTITAGGFEVLSERGIHLDPADSRTLPSLVLKLGNQAETVTITAENDVPLDTGERSDLITAEQIKHLSIEGRDVTELFKTLPGFAINNTGGGSGVGSNAAYDPSQVTVNGALGNYSANGNPLSGVSLKLDGADITDPGNYGAATQTVNYDQVAEVKVEVSNFGADIANGPVVVSVVSRSGAASFHGSLYTYARTSQLDSTDALAKATMSAKDPDHEIYPGFAIGGPVLIPGTSFNHKRRLTFFAGAEDYVQRNIYAYGSAAGALVHGLVPTANMRNGIFTTTELQNYLGPQLYAGGTYSLVDMVPTQAIDGTVLAQPGIIPRQYQDAGFQSIFNAMPLPNQVATNNNPYNWQSQNFVNNDLYEVTGRVDLTISDRNHLFGRYTVERGASGEPDMIFYNEGGLNVPGGGENTINSESAAANLTTVFSSTLTNQLYGGLSYLDSAFKSENLTPLTSYSYQGAYNNSRHTLPSLQSYDTASGLPLQLIPDYSLSPLFSHKFDPEGGDTLTKVWGKHTATFGVYIERITNNQKPTGVTTNGYIQSYYFGGAGTTFTDADNTTKTLSGNAVANYYEGIEGGYGQTNALADTNLYFWNNDFFANDSWRIAPRLTINGGLRIEHLGLWNDSYGGGLAIFNPALIASSSANSPYPGFLWHAIDKSLPTSGNNSKKAFLEPRVGFAYDVHANGSTVLRGGWGEYRSHDSWNDVANALTESQNVQSVTYGDSTLKAISGLNLPVASGTLAHSNTYPSGINLANPAGYAAPGSFYALTPGDNEQPLTDTYSLTLNQQLPFRLNLLVGYVGDNSRFLYNDGSSQTVGLDNVNAIPIGGLYKPNPYTGQVLTPNGTNGAGAAATVVSSAGAQQVNQYRPLNTAAVQYGAINVPQHNLFSNYNALQVGLTHQTGHILFNVNYTWSKALGIQGELGTGTPANPFNVWDNYNLQPFDRANIINGSYTFLLGSPVHNKLLGKFANGWEVSGITNFQSGPTIVSSLNSPGFNITGTIGPAGANQIAINNTTYLGTPDVSLQPAVLCDPRANRGPHQFINGNCFGTPNLLQNGPYRLPVLRGPAYFASDLSAQKTFSIHGEQNLVFRFSAFNFLNHALTSFSGDFPNEYTLTETNPIGAGFNQGVNNPSLGFGSAIYETGRRVSELMVKYNF